MTDTQTVAVSTPTGDGMIEQEEQAALSAIRAAVADLGVELGRRPVDLRALPFAGTWGGASTICRAVASDLVTRELEQAGELEGLAKKDVKRRVNELVGDRAQTLAADVAARLDASGAFAKVEAANGYINIYYDANRVAARLIGEVLVTGAAYGSAPAGSRADRVMVEHSQLNTHKAAHVGHLRNICLGVAITNIIQAAGYPTLPVTYIGDIGKHVVQCLWCYERFHQGEEPAEAMARGRWLGDIYAESEARLTYRDEVLAFLQLLAADDVLFVAAIDRLLKQLWHTNTVDGEDIAYLLGRFSHGLVFKEEEFRRDNVIPRFWPIIGEQLRDQVENPKPYVPVEGEPEPSTTPEERLARWEALSPGMAEWWPRVPTWREEYKQTFQRWERKDPAFVQLWEETRAWSMADLRRIFAEFGAEFEVWFTESEVEEEGRQIARDLLEQGIAEISDGLPVVKIDQRLGLSTPTYRTMPILRSDGTTLYATKDLALTRLKFERYGADRALWVVDVRQSLYFQQISKILELYGFAQAAKSQHISYEWVKLPEGIISSRKGNAPMLEDVRDAVLGRARAVIEDRTSEDKPSRTLDEATRQRVAWQVGIGSLKYAMLARDNNKVVVFDLEEALSFDGHAAPYIQYAHARACRILEHAGAPDAELAERLASLDFGTPAAEELGLLQQIAELPETVQRAATEQRPLHLTNYSYDLAKRFNDFYHTCPVLSSAEPIRTARLALVAATRQTIANALTLLGIEAPDVM